MTSPRRLPAGSADGSPWEQASYASAHPIACDRQTIARDSLSCDDAWRPRRWRSPAASAHGSSPASSN